MYQEFLLVEAKKGNSDSVKEFFTANFSLIYSFRQTFNVKEVEYDDFTQLCFLAFSDAIKYYSLESDKSFLSYYRRCVLHYYSKYKLEMNFPVKLNSSSVKEYCQLEGGGVKNIDYVELDERFEVVEFDMLKDFIWAEVERRLNSFEYSLITKRFCDRKCYEQIAVELASDKDYLRYKQRRILNKLKRSKRLKMLAIEVYGIRIKE